MRVEPLENRHLDGASLHCLDGLTRIARALAGWGVRPPDGGRELVEVMVKAHVDGGPDGDRAAWVLVDGAGVRGFAGATFVDLTPDDGRWTYMPPRFASIPASACHIGTAEAVAAVYDAVRPVVADRGFPRLLVAAAPGADPAESPWRAAGLRADVVMAARDVESRPDAPPDGVVVRTAARADVDGLADLAIEEHLYHATHTATGTSPDQPRETSRRLADNAVTAPPEISRQLVAEHTGSGAIVGSLAASIHVLDDDSLQRFLLPPRYGYIGLTSVTAAHRGTGVGRALVDAALRWFAEERTGRVFLHYVVDNPLSARFWTGRGFTPYAHTDGVWL